MAYTVEKISGNQVKITFEIAADKFDAAMQKAYLKVRGQVNVQGFRKGKAPRKMIENLYGEAVFYDDAFDAIFPEAYEEAVRGENIQVVDRPEVDTVDQIGSGKDLKFSVKVFVKPDVELGSYKGMEAVKYVHTVTAEEVEARINQDAEKATTMEDVEGRALENGDIATLDYAGSVDGVAFAGGTAENQTLEIGSGHFIPGFEEQMVGMNVGEEKDLHVHFPTEYHAQDLAGKEAVFHVKLHGIQVKVKPELNDDFAADVSEFDTFEAYKANIEKQLKEMAEKNADVELENTLVQAATDAAECDIPNQMIEDELDIMVRELQMRMMYQGLRYEDYLKFTGQTEEQVREMYRVEAQNRVKMQLVLDAIATAENVEVSDEDVENAVKEEAERSGRDLETFKKSLSDRQMEYLRGNAVIRKVVDMIVETAKVEVKDEQDRVTAEDAAKAVEEVVEAAEEKKAAKPRKRAAKKTEEKTEE